MKKVVIPGGVQTISASAFQNCGLEEVVLNEGLTTLATGSFSGCKSLESVTFPSTVKTISGFNNSGVKTVAFAEGAAPEAVADDAFAQCENLQSIVLPNSIKTIGARAFLSCYALKSVTLPTGITEIPEETFNDCKTLASIVIPEGVTQIGRNAFLNTSKMASVKLPSTLEVIEENAFNASGIESLTVPEGVTTLYGGTFYNCDSLKTAVLPASLTRMTRSYLNNPNSSGNAPFGDCGRLATLDLSKCKLTELPEQAFMYLPITALGPVCLHADRYPLSAVQRVQVAGHPQAARGHHNHRRGCFQQLRKPNGGRPACHADQDREQRFQPHQGGDLGRLARQADKH